MSVKTGKEIAEKIQDTFWKNDGYSLRDAIHIFLDGNVVVPEEEWQSRKEVLNRLTKIRIDDMKKLERIKMLIENRQSIPYNPDERELYDSSQSFLIYQCERYEKQLEELRKAVMEE